MGGGGALNKLFPGYKDKIWMKVPVEWRQRLIVHWNRQYERQVHLQCVVLNKRMQSYFKAVETLKPDERHALQAVDYKRQIARGTFVEGVDFYMPTAQEQNRLSRPFEPFTEEEWNERKKFSYQSLGWYLAIALGASFVHGVFFQRRPICWCLEKEPPRPPHYPFWFKSILHSHDIPSVRRGYEVYRKICASCHSMEQLHFRHLVGEVLPEKRVKQIAAEYDVEDGPDDKGEMYTRPCVIGDPFPKPYPNEETARYANAGAYPPDLSLITGARMHGPDYIMALLNGYHEPPVGVELRPGLYWNVWFPGNAIAMAPPLQDEAIEYEDGTPCTVSQMSKDVVNFLTWATEPTCDERKLFGLKAVSAAALGCMLATVWWRFFWVAYATRRIDFGKLKGL